MRTTLEIEEDVLHAAREIARQRKISIGKALSDMARQSLIQQTKQTTRNGVPLFPVKADSGMVTLEIVNQLRDEAP
jgi:hypothetical protein